MLPFCVAEEDAISTRNPVRKCDLSILCYQLGIARALRKDFIPPEHARKWICVACIHHPADNSPGYANTLGVAKHVAIATELCCERPITLPR